MAKEIGQSGWRVYLNAGLELIPTEISNTLNINNSIIDSSDKGLGGWAGNINGRRDWSADFELNYDPADAVSMALIDKILDTSDTEAIPVIVGKQTSAGDIAFSGSARIANVSITGSDQDIITMSGSLTGNGALIKIVMS